MKSLEEQLRALPDDAEMRQINADEALRRRILRAAQQKPGAFIRLRPALSIAAAAVVLAGVTAGLVHNARVPSAAKKENALLTSQAAGSSQDLDPNSMLSFYDVRNGTAQIRSASASTYGGIWAQGSGANFPLIGLNGRYYRMLEIENVSGGVLGGMLGQITTYTTEPSLAGGGVVSNIVPEGTGVYAVNGMDQALIAAQVNGKLRVFQRVSYSGSSIVGSERLADTLRCSGRVTAMELGGVGTVSGQNARELTDLLLSGAVYQGAACAETGQNLLIYLDNGLVLQMSVKGERLSACGTWACPDFLTVFAQKAE